MALPASETERGRAEMGEPETLCHRPEGVSRLCDAMGLEGFVGDRHGKGCVQHEDARRMCVGPRWEEKRA